MSPERNIAELCLRLDAGYLPAEELIALLRSADEAEVLAAVLHVERRLREGDSLAGWSSWLPGDVFALPAEAQLVLAALSRDGFGLEVGEGPATLSPLVRLAWLRAGLLARPDSLERYEDTPLGWSAVADLPCERVIATGLLDRMMGSSPSVREAALSYLRGGLERGLLGRAQAHDYALRLAHDGNAAIAIAALRFLKEPWTFAIPLPQLRQPFGQDGDVAREAVQVLAARREVQQLRSLLTCDPSHALVPDLLTALGVSGTSSDIALILEQLQTAPEAFGRPGMTALVTLKRRGLSPNDDEARALLALYLQHPNLDAGMMAEVVSSRADRVVDALEAAPHETAYWPQIVALLEALGTRRALARLKSTLARPEEHAAWWYAIRALGRLGSSDAEIEILARLDQEPESCLDALRSIGGEATVQALMQRVAQDPPPVWLQPAIELLFELAPSRSLFEQLAHSGLITGRVLDTLADHGELSQCGAMRTALTQHGHPLRLPAIRALGRIGGPLALDLLSELLADPDETIRVEAVAALRALGPRLQEQGSVRPASLASAANPAGALVAEALVRRLRARVLEPDVCIPLLESLIGLEHAQLVPVVRPYLRHKAPEVRKRVLACLGSAGEAASAWVLPWLLDDDVTVARQALRALVQVRAVGLAEPVAQWLDASNMNMKKAAAEALAVVGDRSVAPKLIHWLARHDNPGFRQLLVVALKAILGPWFVTSLIDQLSVAADARARGLLIEALSGALSASDVAALVQLRASPENSGEAWIGLLLQRIYDDECALSSGTPAELDLELERRGCSARIPQAAPGTRRKEASRAEASRAGVALRRTLRRYRCREPGAVLELAALLRKANVRGQLLAPSLSRAEIHSLLDIYDELGSEEQAGARQLLSVVELEPVARLRTTRFVRKRSPDEVPPGLLLHTLSSASAELARRLLDCPERKVQELATTVALLDDATGAGPWPERAAPPLVFQLIRKGALDAGFEWSRQRGQLPTLIRGLRRLRGEAFALAQLKRWLDAEPAWTAPLIAELLQFGPAADAELERLAKSSDVALHLREQLLSELGRRAPSASSPALFRELLADRHPALRELAARSLLRLAEKDDRERIVACYLDGAFREQFSLQLGHADLPLLARTPQELEGARDLRLVRLLASLRDPRQIPLLLELWKTGDEETKAHARDALRALDAERVLSYLWPDLDGGDDSVLEVLGPLSAIPQRLVDSYELASDRTAWQRFLERTSAAGVVHAPGLAEKLARSFRQGRGNAAVLRLFVRLDDWSQAAKVKQMAAATEHLLAFDQREDLLRSVVEATAELGVALRVAILASIGRASDEPIVLALLDAVLDSPLVREALPVPLVAAIEQRMSRELRGEPERARRILSYRGARAKTDIERRELLDALESGLRHSSRRVRLHAHRLLRSHAERAHYLRATRVLLDDDDAATVCSAIRVVTFGGDLEAIPAIVELLSHSQASVRAAAREGLLQLGTDAVPSLTRAMGRARPDRRPPLADILHEIEQRSHSAS